MPSWIEFHDSELISVARSDLDVSIVLDAYVHRWEDGDLRRGTGWMQQIRLMVGRAVASIPTLAASGPIADGEIRIGALSHSNLVKIPIKSEEPVSLKIQLVTGEILEVTGEAARSESIGEARYVEDLPADLWPDILSKAVTQSHLQDTRSTRRRIRRTGTVPVGVPLSNAEPCRSMSVHGIA